MLRVVSRQSPICLQSPSLIDANNNNSSLNFEYEVGQEAKEDDGKQQNAVTFEAVVEELTERQKKDKVQEDVKSKQVVGSSRYITFQNVDRAVVRAFSFFTAKSLRCSFNPGRIRIAQRPTHGRKSRAGSRRRARFIDRKCRRLRDGAIRSKLDPGSRRFGRFGRFGRRNHRSFRGSVSGSVTNSATAFETASS